MSDFENKVFDTINKPKIYLRYADNILLLTNSTEINIIQETFQNNPVLNFTQDINIKNKISFLGVIIDTSNIDLFTTMKGPKAHGKILVNSSTNSNLKPRQLSRNLKGS